MELIQKAKAITNSLGIKEDKAFSMLIIAGFSAILVGAVFLIIGILVVNAVNNAIGLITTGPMNTTQASVMTSIGQAFTIGGVALIVVGVAVIVAVLFGNFCRLILDHTGNFSVSDHKDRNGGRRLWRRRTQIICIPTVASNPVSMYMAIG
jgi:hypothetical protein